jgi:tetratricopeptide (TPR) repeat protein
MSARTNSCLAAAVLACGAAFAQPSRQDPQTALAAQITDMRAEKGPTAAELIGPLHVLGLLYQESGDHVLAVAALEEARYVTRVHSGLSSIDEALLLRQQIRNEKALADPQRAWDHQQEMLAIARKHLDDTRMVPIFRDLAADRSEVLERVRVGKNPPELYLGCYYGEARPRYDDPRGEQSPAIDNGDNCRFGTRDNVIRKLRDEILLYYADAIEVIDKNGDYASQDLRDLERQALRVEFFAPYLVLPSEGNATLGLTHFTGVQLSCPNETLDELLATKLLGDCLEPVIQSEGHVVANVGSWVSLVRLIAYEIRSGATAADRASAFVELADWHLLSTPADRRRFEESTNRAFEIYERAYREEQPAADRQTWTTQVFSPDLPVTLPTNEPNPFASAATDASSRFIDVSFAVTKYGRGERIEILATSQGATRAEEHDLIHLIETTSFRPRFVDDKLADSAPVTLRYRLDR